MKVCILLPWCAQVWCSPAKRRVLQQLGLPASDMALLAEDPEQVRVAGRQSWKIWGEQSHIHQTHKAYVHCICPKHVPFALVCCCAHVPHAQSCAHIARTCLPCVCLFCYGCFSGPIGECATCAAVADVAQHGHQRHPQSCAAGWMCMQF